MAQPVASSSNLYGTVTATPQLLEPSSSTDIGRLSVFCTFVTGHFQSLYKEMAFVNIMTTICKLSNN